MQGCHKFNVCACRIQKRNDHSPMVLCVTLWRNRDVFPGVSQLLRDDDWKRLQQTFYYRFMSFADLLSLNHKAKYGKSVRKDPKKRLFIINGECMFPACALCRWVLMSWSSCAPTSLASAPTTPLKCHRGKPFRRREDTSKPGFICKGRISSR